LAGLLSDRQFIGANPQSLCEELMLPKVLVVLPIVDEQHLVVGIITQSYILKFVIGNEIFTNIAKAYGIEDYKYLYENY
jgi:CBS-domain-containing membrane protein